MRRLWADPAWAGVVFYLGGRDVEALERLCAEAVGLGAQAKPWLLDLSPEAETRMRVELPASSQSGAGVSAWAHGEAHPAWRQGSVGKALALPAGLPPVKGFLFAAGKTGDRILPRLGEEAWDRILDVNLRGHATLLRFLAVPGVLAPNARGLLVGSISGLRGREGQSAYAAAKGGLLDLLPLVPAGLRLNVLLPPLLSSPLLDALGPAARARLFQDRLMDDPDAAASCAEAAAFLLSDEASYIHGQGIHADSRVTALGWE
ncbi:MAG: SDR family oxidoreductase [bacterium]